MNRLAFKMHLNEGQKNELNANLNRRNFIQKIGVGAAAVGAFSLTSCGDDNKQSTDLPKDADGNVIPGFGKEGHEESKKVAAKTSDIWQSKSSQC